MVNRSTCDPHVVAKNIEWDSEAVSGNIENATALGTLDVSVPLSEPHRNLQKEGSRVRGISPLVTPSEDGDEMTKGPASSARATGSTSIKGDLDYSGCGCNC